MIDGEKGCKVRLVVHGNQAMDQLNTDLPTVRKSSLRLLFFIAVQYGWRVKTADVTSAFLQADQLDRDVHVKPPADIHVAGTLWKLWVPVYGMGDSGKKWYLTISVWLVNKGCIKADHDPAFFFYVWKGELRGVICLHVDDGIYCGDTIFEEKIIKPMMERFQFGKIEEGDFKSLGWNIENNSNKEILVSQVEYIESKLEYLPLEQEGLHLDKTSLS